MPELIAGMDKKQLLIYGGIGALGVGIVVYLRYQSAQNTPPQEAFPQAPPDTGGGGGGGYGVPVSVSAPSQNAADQYQAGLKQAEVDAANLQNQYMGEQLRQSKSAFDLQQSLQKQEFEIMKPAEQAYAGEQAAQFAFGQEQFKQEQKQLAKTGISCPGSASPRQVPDDNGNLIWVCRQKTSGGVLGIPIGDIVRAVQGFVSGVEKAAPEAGYSAGKAAGQGFSQYLGKRAAAGFKGRGSSGGESAEQSQSNNNYSQLPPQGNYGGNF